MEISDAESSENVRKSRCVMVIVHPVCGKKKQKGIAIFKSSNKGKT